MYMKKVVKLLVSMVLTACVLLTMISSSFALTCDIKLLLNNTLCENGATTNYTFVDFKGFSTTPGTAVLAYEMNPYTGQWVQKMWCNEAYTKYVNSYGYFWWCFDMGKYQVPNSPRIEIPVGRHDIKLVLINGGEVVEKYYYFYYFPGL